MKKMHIMKKILYHYTYKHYLLVTIPIAILTFVFFNIYALALNYTKEQKKACYDAIQYDMDTLVINNSHISVFSYIDLSVKKAEQIIYKKAPEKREYVHDMNWIRDYVEDYYGEEFSDDWRSFNNIRLNQAVEIIQAKEEKAYTNTRNKWYNEIGRFWNAGIRKLYYVDTEKNTDSGWLIARNYFFKDKKKASTSFLYPNKVGVFEVREDESVNMDKANKCCDEAYTQILDNFTPAKLTLNEYYSKAENLENKYYYVKVDSTGKDTELSFDKNVEVKNEQGITYITRLPKRTFIICEKMKNQEYEEAEKIDIVGKIICVILLMLSLYWVYRFARSRRVTLNEALYKDLVVKCNPTRFMKPYNKKRVEVANALTQLLIQTSPNDEEVVAGIVDTAQSKLGINIVGKKYVRQLKKIIYPKKFLKPYDERKFALANELYTALANGDVSYTIIKDVDKRAVELL